MFDNPQYILLFDYFARFLRLAHTHGIAVAPLKGAHLLTEVYPRGEDRGVLSDIDFLVRERDYERSFPLLEQLGFVRRRTLRRHATDEVSEDTGFRLELAPGVRILFEVHQHLERKGRHPIDYDALWERAQPSTFDGVACMRLSPEDHLLHAVLHLYTDRFGNARRALRDIELLLTRSQASLDTVRQRARDWECTRATWLAMRLLRERKPELDLSATIEALRPAGSVASALTWLVPSADGFRFPHAGLRLQEAMLWPWLMENPRRALRFAASYALVRLRDLRGASVS